MDTSRAKQIFESKNTYDVQLEGSSVWIENVDVENGTATVSIGNNTQTVPVEKLQEAST